MTNAVVAIVIAFIVGFCVGAFLGAITVLRAKERVATDRDGAVWISDWRDGVARDGAQGRIVAAYVSQQMQVLDASE